MYAAFDLPVQPEGEVVIVNETDDGSVMFEKVAGSLGSDGVVAVGDRAPAEAVLNLGRVAGFERLQPGSRLVNELRRVKDDDELEAMTRAVATVEQAMRAVAPLVVPGVAMATLVEAVEHELRSAGSRCPSFTTHMFTGFEPAAYDSGTESAWTPVPEGTSVMFDFGGVVDGYCSDFGRTVYCGEPPDDYREVYEIMLAAQESGRAAATPGTPACEVNAACRRPIEDAGLGEYFRHRMGHGIGMNVHERPFLSPEDDTALESRMTFTDEPSIMIPNRFSVRIEDIIVVEEGGGRTLNSYPTDLVANP
jgi:Xaa-Pro dipeptidase